MQKLIDKLLLLGLCLLAMSFAEIAWLSVAAMLTAIAVSSLCGYLEGGVPARLCVLYSVMCLFLPEFILFLPLIVYDCAGRAKWFFRFCWVAALPLGVFIGGVQIPVVVILSCGTAFLLQYRTGEQLKVRGEYFTLEDSTKERAVLLERKNRDLLEKQDYELRLATLAERNRIAREIHDNVGHLLTRSILQIGALRVTRAGDEKLTGELDTIKDTLTDAMDSIRSSVHNLHDESADLRLQLQAMTDGFKFCPVRLRYDAGQLPGEIKSCFASVVREALSNIARHSGASEAAVVVTEHPAFCQLIVADNGTGKTDKAAAGIGLQNMADRVNALGGIFRQENDKGFKIFISVPKEITR